MSGSDNFKANVNRWVDVALKNEEVEKFKVEISGNTAKSDGYLGDIVFVDVSSILKNGKNKTFYLAFKLGKSSEALRKAWPVTEVYNREMYIYREILPYFDRFQREKINEKIDYVSKCYATFNEYGTEALILENLKKIGYELHNQMKPMNLEHIKLVFENYGKWHALSFALMDQRNQIFCELTKNLTYNVMVSFMENEDTVKSVDNKIDLVKEMLKERNENELLRKFSQVTKNGFKQTLIDLSNIPEKQVVVSHGDCWNNNFMFHYEEISKKTPDKMVILDWQLSSLVSPVFDLSYFLYMVTTESELQHFEEFLETYHNSFSRHMRKLGSDPDKYFSYADLIAHWRKYSLYGFMMAPGVLQFVLCDKDEAPSLGDINDEHQVSNVMGLLKVKDMDQYYRRIKAVIDHYTKFNNIP